MGFKFINRKFTGKPDKVTALNRAIMATVLGLFMSTFLIQPLSISTSTLFSSLDKYDFKLPDLYAQIADNRPVKKLEDRIAILNIGRSNREEIAECLSLLSLCGPKAVGIDINFAEPSEDDSFLLESLNNLPGLVLPLGVSGSKKGGVFEIEDKPFFYNDFPNIKYGVVNLPMNTEKGTVREYAIEFPTEEKILPSFVVALAQIADPKIVKRLLDRNSETGTVAYHSKEFNIINIEEVEEYAEQLADKIILVGTVEDSADMHASTIKSHVAGVMLHAAALSTVLDGLWFTNVPKSFDYAIAIILCFIITLMVYGMKNKFKGLILRIVQFGLVYLAVRIGYSLYLNHNIIFDISYTVTIVLLGLFAVDIWNGIEATWTFLTEKIESIDKKLKTSSKKMAKQFLTILLIILCAPLAMAHYSIHSVSQGVTVESGSKTSPAKKGMELKASDYLVIPEGAEVEIYNDLDKNIYKSLKSGKISVTRLMIDAKKEASDNRKNVGNRLRLAKNQDEAAGEKIYVEKGMVRRSLAVFDPDAELQIDAKTLGGLIADYFISNDTTGLNGVDIVAKTGDINPQGAFFRIENTLEFPVYFNVLKINMKPNDENRNVEISKLGQPDGSYVLLPGQAVTRESFTSIPQDEKHLLVVTHFRYDLDEVIDETDKALKNSTSDKFYPSFPLIIKNIK